MISPAGQTRTATTKMMPTNGGMMPTKVASSSPAALNTTFYANGTRHNSLSPADNHQQQRGSLTDEISLAEIFRLIAHMKICVVRRSGSGVEAQISAMIETAAATRPHANKNGRKEEEGEEEEDAPPVAHFISIGQRNAGQMLDWVQRNGLPLIFLDGICVGGLAELNALEKCGFLAEALRPRQFDLIVVMGGGGNEVAEKAIEEAVELGKRVALVELVTTGTGKKIGTMMGNNHNNGGGGDCRLAKEAVNQAALMRTAIEEARSSGWTVEGEEGQKVSFWLDWRTVHEGILRRKEAQRAKIEAIFQQGKARRFGALSCHFSGFHEVTICPADQMGDSEQQKCQADDGALIRLNAHRFLLAINAEPTNNLDAVPGAKEYGISHGQLFMADRNPGKTLFCCDSAEDCPPSMLESAAILRALGNDVTIMSRWCPPPSTIPPSAPPPSNSSFHHASPSSYDSEFIEHIKLGLAQKGVRFLTCVPTKFEQLRESCENKTSIVRVHAMMMDIANNGGSEGKNAFDGIVGADADCGAGTFVEEFNTVVLITEKCREPFHGLGLDKIGALLEGAEKGGGRRRQQQFGGTAATTLVPPNIFTAGNVPDADSWHCFEAKQLMRRIFQGEMNPIVQTDLCRTLLLPPLEYACCGLSEKEAERKYGGKEALRVLRDGQVPIGNVMVEKAKMVCLKLEQDRVVGLHIVAAGASKLLHGYALAMQLGLTRGKMAEMANC